MKLLKAVCLIMALIFALPVIPAASAGASGGIKADAAYVSLTGAEASYFAAESATRFKATGSEPTVKYDVSSHDASASFAVVTYRVAPSNSIAAAEGTIEFLDGDAVLLSKNVQYVRGYKCYSAVVNITGASGADSVVYTLFNSCDSGDYIYFYGIEFYNTEDEAKSAAAAAADDANGSVVAEYTESALASNSYVWQDYMVPYWDTGLIINEAVYPLKNQDGTMNDVTLMYSADRIISVKSSALDCEYKEGTDYELVNGKLRILPTGDINLINYSDHYYTYNKSGSYRMNMVDSSRYVRFQEGPYIPNDQIAVTYTHSDSWSGFLPANQGESLPRTLSKLENGGALKIVFFGDSITNGGNSSGEIGMAPYAERWTVMFEKELKRLYPDASITCQNTSVSGGSWSPEAVDNVQGSIINNSPDLVVLALGTNDYQFQYSANSTYNSMSYVVDQIKSKLPNCEIVLVAPMLSNPECFNSALLDQYIAGYRRKAAEYDGIVIADVNAVHKYLLTKKIYTDLSANNLCHLNDTFARVYAQVLIKTITPSSLSAKYKSTFRKIVEGPVDYSKYSEEDAASIRTLIDGAEAESASAKTFEEFKAVISDTVKKINLYPEKSEYVNRIFEDGKLIFDKAEYTSLFSSILYEDLTYNADNNAISMRSTANRRDLHATLKFPESYPVSATANKYIVITYKSPETNSAIAETTQLYLCSGSITSMKESNCVTFNPIKDGTYHSEIIDMSEASWWSGRISRIRIDSFATSMKNDILYLSSICFCESAEEAAKVAARRADDANGIESGDFAITAFDSESSLSAIVTPGVTLFKGDIDGDGVVTAKDVKSIKVMIVGAELDDAEAVVSPDLDEDGILTAEDVKLLKRIVSGTADPEYVQTVTSGIEKSFDSDDGAALITFAAGKYATIRTNADFTPTFAVIKYRTDSEAETEVFFGDNISTAPSSRVSFSSGDAFNYLKIAVPTGTKCDSVTLNVGGISIDVAAVALFECELGADRYVEGYTGGGTTVAEDGEITDDNVRFAFNADSVSSIAVTNASTYTVENGVLRFTVSSERIDPYVYFDFSSLGVSADEYKYVVYNYMVPTTASSRATQAQIFFCSSNATVPAEASSQKFTIQKNGNFVNQVIDLSSASYWGGSVLGMRFDYFCDASSGDVCYLGSVTFCKTQEDVEAAIK